MRLYAFLLLVAALYAHAATIPVAQSEKKDFDVVPHDLDKLENVSSEQELIDQVNTIKDVENKLRVKPEDIPVKVIVEDAQPVLKTSDENEESQEIIRTVPDLRNPGPPQRQEHETQNPGYYANEQQTITKFKQSINEAQNVLKQGFQGITDGIQSMIENNEPIQKIQHRVQVLREGFIAEIQKLNGTIQNYLGMESSVDQPAVEQTKANFRKIEEGLKVLENDFNKGVNTLADGVEVVAYLKAESGSNPSTGISPAPVNTSPSTPLAPFGIFIQNMRDQLVNRLQNLLPNTNTADVPAGAQSDTQGPSTSKPGNWWDGFNFSNPLQGFGQQNPLEVFGNNPIIQFFQGAFGNFFPGTQTQGTQPAQTGSKPIQSANNVESKPEVKPEPQPEKPDSHQTNTEKSAPTPTGPIQQILQNNPIRKGIASAVQRIQNINNPEKPRDDEEVKEQNETVKNQDEDKSESETKGHYGYGGGQNSGDNNNSNNSGLKENEVVKKDVEKLPEVQKPEDEVKEHKTEEVVDKTE